jgi:hypothetical protein
LGNIANHRHHIPVLEGRYCLLVDAEYESPFTNRLASRLQPTARCRAEIQHPLASAYEMVPSYDLKQFE